MHRSWTRGVTFALIAVATFTGCSKTPEPKGPWRSVLLVTVDTLRADRIGAYGHDVETSPRLDALAARSARFERALVPIPRTTQSLASLLTSKNPIGHGVRRLEHSLDAAHVTLAERFADAGYDTGAFVVIPFLNPMTGAQGLDQGFQSFESFPDSRGVSRDARAEEVVDAAVRWIAERDDRPWFLWVHLRDPHAPYWNHAGDASTGGGLADVETPDYRGTWESYFHYWAVKPSGRPAGGITDAHRRRKGRLKFGHDRMSDEDIARAIALYDGEILYTDHHFGRMLDALDERGRADDTVVVLTADHGESLGEHDFWFDHGEFVYDATLRVPLVFHAPTKPATVIPGQVGTVDVGATLVELFGLAPLPGADGRSFADALDGGAFVGRNVLAESGEPLMAGHNPRFEGGGKPADPKHRLRGTSLAAGKKLIYDPFSESWQLFSWENDSEEDRNLIDEPDASEGLDGPRALLRQLSAGDVSFDASELSDEARQALEEQGYLAPGKRKPPEKPR